MPNFTKARYTIGWLILLGLLAASVRAAEPEDYILDTGDRVRIRIQGWPDITGEYLVSPSGTVAIAGIGAVEARGLGLTELSTRISARLAEAAQMSPPPVTLTDIIRYRSVFVAGDVQKPGEYEYQPGLTVLKALSVAGGYYRPPVAGFQRFERDALLARGEASTFAAKSARLKVLIARLDAEIAGRATVDMPPDSVADIPASLMKQLTSEATAVLTANRNMLAERTKSFEASKSLLDQEIKSLGRQMDFESRQLEYVKRELDKMRDLADRGLASSPRMLELERVSAQINGARQALETSIVRARQEIQKLDQKIAEARDDAVNKATIELQKARLDLDEAEGKRRTSLSLAHEAEVFAPAALTRHESERPQYTYIIIREPRGGERQQFEADRYTPVRPGDIVEVTRKPDEATSNVTAAVPVR